jgi:pimeloyl-ACP methyl ester carboxylesterase
MEVDVILAPAERVWRSRIASCEPEVSPVCRKHFLLTFSLVLLAASALAQSTATVPVIRAADIGHGITLHYVEEGKGVPVIFVHGSISDGGYWADQLPEFAIHYRAISYSRRYDFPNENPAQPGYSAVTDADDLAAFIDKLHLGKVVVIGHSYGALTALFVGTRHPELVRALVLAEAPAVSLLEHLPGDQARAGHEAFKDIQRRMVTPMQEAFRKVDREGGVRAFIDYVFSDPNAWDKMSPSSREQTMRDAHEWDVMMTTGTLFPVIEPGAIRKIKAPVLILAGAKSYPHHPSEPRQSACEPHLEAVLGKTRHLIDPIRPTRWHTSISPHCGLYEMPSLCVSA